MPTNTATPAPPTHLNVEVSSDQTVPLNHTSYLEGNDADGRGGWEGCVCGRIALSDVASHEWVSG